MNSVLRRMTKRVFKKPPTPFDGWKILRGDTVEVISGKSKGSRGTVVKVLRKEQRAIVEGVNLTKRFVAPTDTEKGRIDELESPIHISNLSLIDPVSDKTTRVRFSKQADGSKARVSVDSNTIIPRPEILQKRRQPTPPASSKCTLAEDVLAVTYVPTASV